MATQTPKKRKFKKLALPLSRPRSSAKPKMAKLMRSKLIRSKPRFKSRVSKPKKQSGINPNTLLHGRTTVSRKPVKNTTYGKSINIKKIRKTTLPSLRKTYSPKKKKKK